MRANSKLPERKRCSTDLHLFWTRASWVLFPAVLALVCAAQRNRPYAASTPAGQCSEPGLAPASRSRIHIPPKVTRGPVAPPHQAANPDPRSANPRIAPVPSSPQPVTLPLPASVATVVRPEPEAVQNAAPGRNEPPSPPAESDLPPPLSAPPDDEGTGQPYPEQVPAEASPAFQAPGGARDGDAPGDDRPLTPVAPGFPEPVSPAPRLNAAPNPDAAESDQDRTWRLSIQLALHDTNVAHVVVEEARLDRIPDAAWLSITATLLGQPVPSEAPPTASLSGPGSLTTENLLARIDLAEQLALVVPKPATRQVLEQVCLSLARQFKRHIS